MAYTATTGPSATWIQEPLELLKPSHFLLRLGDGADLSPPAPSHTLPSAIPAASSPLGDTAIDNTNGGDNEIPEVGGGAATNFDSTS